MCISIRAFFCLCTTLSSTTHTHTHAHIHLYLSSTLSRKICVGPFICTVIRFWNERSALSGSAAGKTKLFYLLNALMFLPLCVVQCFARKHMCECALICIRKRICACVYLWCVCDRQAQHALTSCFWFNYGFNFVCKYNSVLVKG